MSLMKMIIHRKFMFWSSLFITFSALLNILFSSILTCVIQIRTISSTLIHSNLKKQKNSFHFTKIELYILNTENIVLFRI